MEQQLKDVQDAITIVKQAQRQCSRAPNCVWNKLSDFIYRLRQREDEIAKALYADALYDTELAVVA